MTSSAFCRALFIFPLSFALAACGGDTDNNGSGAGGEGAGSGGASSGSGGNNGGGSTGSCELDSDCVAASQTRNACYSQGCSSPQAASVSDVANDACLLAWEGTEAPARPASCVDKDGPEIACPALCAAPPSCVSAFCDAGQCKLNLGYSADECQGEPNDCAQLEAERKSTLEAARSCIANGDNVECSAGDSVADDCGCPIAVNDNKPTQVAAAESARAAWAAKCEPPMRCQLVDCASESDSGTCEANSGTEGICRFE